MTDDAAGTPTWSEKVELLAAWLGAYGIPHAFGGAIAMNYHREPRATLDIDVNVFVREGEEGELLELLRERIPQMDVDALARELAAHGQGRALWGDTFVDVFLANTDFHLSMARRARAEPFGDRTISVLSIEDLLVCKALFDRPKDWVDIAAVGATRAGQLDVAYVERWLGEFVEPDDERFTRLRGALG